MTVTLLYLASSLTRRVYNYWFNTSDNAQMREDVSAWTIHIILYAIMTLLYALHMLLKFTVAAVQMLPFSSIILYWPKFYWSIL